MANCTDLECISKYFRLMCVTLLSSGNDVECLKARSTLQLLIEERPDNTVEINKIIKRIYRSQDMKS